MLWLLAGGSNPRKGDLLVIAGATLYAISNVSEVSRLRFFWIAGSGKFALLCQSMFLLDVHSMLILNWYSFV